MDLIGPRRPSLSRETRLLLVTIVVSLTALWILARIRFADRPVTPNPITPVLTQLAPPPVFDQLASAVFQVQSRLAPLLTGVEIRGTTASGAPRAISVAALRLDADTAVAMLDDVPVAGEADRAQGATIIARDPASGLAVVRVTDKREDGPMPALPLWSPRQPQAPRYLVAGEVSVGGVAGRPLFVGPLNAFASQTWSDVVWELPETTAAAPGTFLFTLDGSLAGLVAQTGGRLALIPGETITTAAERLRRAGPLEYGWLGIEARQVTPAVAAGTGAPAGVIVTWVDAQGPAAGKLDITDVIVGVGDEELATEEHWQAVAARVTVGEPLVLRVRRRGAILDVELTAAPADSAVPDASPLGLTMRVRQGVGVEVLTVAPGSAGARAGLQPGDVITIIGERKAPTPAQVRGDFAAAPADRPLILAVTRGSAHHVMTIENR